MPSPANEQALSGTNVLSLKHVLQHWKQLLAGATFGGALFTGIVFLIPPTFTARTVFISPQPQQNSAAAAIAALGPLSGLAGAATGVKSPTDQYLSLLTSNTLVDRIIDRFNLFNVYRTKLRADTRRELLTHVRMSVGKKDGLISLEVDDHEAQRAADIANGFTDELQALINQLALTEAQHRRKFFDEQFRTAQLALTNAQLTLQKIGFDPRTINTEPRAAAETYAKLKSQISAAEVKLSIAEITMSPQSIEVTTQQKALTRMRAQLRQMEQPSSSEDAAGYLDAYRNFKYQESLFEIYARQFELAKLDEARQGSLIQTLDKAQKPERKAKPQRTVFALIGASTGILLAVGNIIFRRRAPYTSRSAAQ